MKTIEYRTIDKSAWLDGPWKDEADKIQWQDEATGLPCLIVRNAFGGHLCGYVGVPEGHSLFKMPYTDADVTAHGGLTFSDTCQPDAEEHGICHLPDEGESDHVWWLGFDCAHSHDYCPGYAKLRLSVLASGGTYKTIEYVRNECADLAKQIAAFNN
jgi:hypothetical protein